MRCLEDGIHQRPAPPVQGRQVRYFETVVVHVQDHHPGLTQPLGVFGNILRDELVRIAAGEAPWRDGLGDQVKLAIEADRQAKADAQQEQDRMAMAIVSAALGDLGYVVEPIAESISTHGGHMYFRNSNWDPGYYVRLESRPERNRLTFRMVRTEGTPENDTEMETRLCEKDYKAIYSQMKQRSCCQ